MNQGEVKGYQLRVFLSYHTPDRETAIALKAAIAAARPDVDVFLDQSHLRYGYNWQPALYEAIDKSDAFVTLIGNRLGSWQTAEYYAAHDKKVRHPDTYILLPLVIADRRKGPVPNLPGLSQLHWIECSEPTGPDALPKILSALSGIDLTQRPKPWMLVNPYRGLMALEEQDSEFFVGREAETEQAINTISFNRNHIAVLIGNSGVGKSSLVQAGVIACLRRGRFANGTRLPDAIRDSHEWAYVSFRPADDPVRNLVAAFVSLWFSSTTDTAKYKKITEWTDHLADGGTLQDLYEATRERFEELGQVAPKRIFVYVDQAEEMYSRGNDASMKRLSALLGNAASIPEFVLMLSQRSDYYGNFQANLDLFSRAAVIDVTPLNRDQLVRVLREPAARLGVTFYPKELPEQLVEAAAGQPGALALLADIMIEVWEKMQQRGSDGVIRPLEDAPVLDIERPLARRADRFIAENPEDRPLIERLFALRLMKILEHGDPFRRRVYESDCSPAEWRVLTLMSTPEWRLVVSGSEQDAAFAEVAHDILLSKWPALKTLIARERQFLLWRTDTEREFDRWLEAWLGADALPTDQSARREFNTSVFGRQDITRGNRELLSGSRLKAAVDMLASRSEDIDPHLQNFIGRSQEIASQTEEIVRRQTAEGARGGEYRADLRVRVFMTYARQDMHIVEALTTALEDKGVEVLLDRRSIVAGEEWRERLNSLIAASDCIVFVMSEASLASETCTWELNEGSRLQRRIVPFAVGPVRQNQMPPEIAQLSHIFFNEQQGVGSFVNSVRQLEHAIKIDVGWRREAARLMSRALEWEASERSQDRLLSGADIAAALTWRDRSPSVDEQMPREVAEFIAESVRMDKRRRRKSTRGAFESELRKSDAREPPLSLVWALAVMLFIASGLAVAGWWNVFMPSIKASGD